MLGPRIGLGWWAPTVLLATLGQVAIAAPLKPPEKPAKITVSVAPESVAPGGQAVVTLTIDPISGVKINRYPQIKLTVPDQQGLVGEIEAAIGSKTPLPLDDQGSNFWKTVDPVKLTLTVDAAATTGEHEIEAKLIYYYCVSGNFCAPKRVPLTIPLDVE